MKNKTSQAPEEFSEKSNFTANRISQKNANVKSQNQK